MSDIELQNEILNLQNQLAALTTEANENRQQIVNNMDSLKEPRFPDPPSFNGKRRDSALWLSRLLLVFSQQPLRFASDSAKVAYAGAFLGEAFGWFSQFVVSNDVEVLNSWENFKAAFLEVYGDLDVQHHEKELYELRQGNSSFSDVVVEIQRLSSLARVPKNQLFYITYQAASEELKDELAKIPRPESIARYWSYAIEMDSRIRARRLEKRKLSSKFPPPKTFPPARSFPPVPFQRSLTPVNVPEPMEIDAMRRRGPLSPEERQRRMANGLCLVCGDKGHLRLNCPVARHNSPEESGKEESQ